VLEMRNRRFHPLEPLRDFIIHQARIVYAPSDASSLIFAKAQRPDGCWLCLNKTETPARSF
jgi:hypothetical protein